MKVEHCKRCLMPSSRPRIVFTDGVCNACHWAEERHDINYEERADLFGMLVEKHKKHPAYDMIVPFSGGKDSAYIAYQLRAMGYNPLLVTYGQLMWTDVGRHNWHAVRDAGFDILYWGVNQRVSRQLARRFFIERGHPKQHYDSGVNSVPIITSRQMGIPLVIYAEHGESEYGGLVLSEDHRRRRDLDEVLENQVGDDARNWATDGLSEADMWPYVYPDNVDGIEAVYFSWYFPWDILHNAKTAKNKLGFKQANSRNRWWHPDKGKWLHYSPSSHSHRRWLIDECYPKWWGKSDGSFEGFDSIDDKIDDLDFYMMHIKFGFGRATRMASRLIQRGHMEREDALKLVEIFDGEFPGTYFKDVLEYLDMTQDELFATVEQHRNPEIWTPEKKLKYPPT
jgi:N-acetyl sugar amidotransferase